MVDMDAELDENLIADLLCIGHSRVPVIANGDRNSVKGLLILERLLMIDPKFKRPVRHFAMRKPIVVAESTPMLEMLHLFQVLVCMCVCEACGQCVGGGGRYS
jgi:CBS domain containing-hemolysin-like protein